MTCTDGYVPTAPGIQLYYQLVGDGDDAVIVPHAAYLFQHFSHLAVNRRLIFIDWRNRGRSTTVTDPAALALGILHDVEDLEAVRTHFGLARISLITHSYSAWTAALFARRHHAHVHRIVQLGPMQPCFEMQYPAHLTCADESYHDFIERFGRLQRQRASLDPVEFCTQCWALLRRLYVADPADAGKLDWSPCHLPNELAFMGHWLRNLLPSIQALQLTSAQIGEIVAPVLVIHGRRDRSAPYGGGRDWAGLLPNARLLTVDHAAHVPWIEAPDLVFSSIDTFLAGKWPDAARTVNLSDDEA